MLISCNILKKHIKNSDTIDFISLWDKFTIRSAEVEGVTLKGYKTDKVVAAKIVECIDHPKSDHAKIVKVDVTTCEATEVNYNIRNIPALLLFKNGEVVAQQVGAAPKSKLTAFIEDNI